MVKLKQRPIGPGHIHFTKPEFSLIMESLIPVKEERYAYNRAFLNMISRDFTQHTLFTRLELKAILSALAEWKEDLENEISEWEAEDNMGTQHELRSIRIIKTKIQDILVRMNEPAACDSNLQESTK